MKPYLIDHIVIVVKNIDITVNFYGNFLGEPIAKDHQQVAYQVGEIKIFFVLPYKNYEWHDKDKYGFNHLAFGVRSSGELKSFEKKLNEGSIKNSGIKTDKFGKKEFIWFDDPDGYRLEFYYRPK